MNIEKAIELLQKDIDNPGSVAIEDVNEAEELAIRIMNIHRQEFPNLLDTGSSG